MTTEELLARIRALELENEQLRQGKLDYKSTEACVVAAAPEELEYNGLSLAEYRRYGRQMIVPEFGAVDGQLKLKNAKILVVGAGGLGCPVLLYLSAAGIGHIGIIDDDTVDESNLHRQVLHTTDNVGMFKCDSAKRYISRLNPCVKVETYPTRLTNDNAFDIIAKYDLILDCTDAPAIRYLINDVCVLLGKTIVSGAGLKMDGQWTILNFENKGPCYRCFHPKPPPADSVTSCQDGGVLGPAIGLIGVNMAMEAMKVLLGHYSSDTFSPFLNVYYGAQKQQFRTFKMRGRQKNCAIAGETPVITREMIESGEIDYHAFCGRSIPYPLPSDLNTPVKAFQQHLQHNKDSLIIDVRPKEQFKIVSLANSINIPIGDLVKMDEIKQFIPPDTSIDSQIFVICRYGNDSRLATKLILEKTPFTNVKNVIGGLNQWSREVDPSLPIY